MRRRLGLALVLVCALGTPAGQAASHRSADTASSAVELVYRGTLKISVAYYGYDCRTFRDTKLHFQRSRTYRMPVYVTTNSPIDFEGSQENNPFNLVISADVGNEAGIQIRSALVISNFQSGQNALFEFWKISKNGSRVNGRLTESWRELGPALAQNVFPTDRPLGACSPIVIPKTLQSIDEGARLTGTLTTRRAVLTVKGRTFDKERRFTARITATR